MKNVYSKLIFGRAKLNCCISHTFLNLHFWSSLGQFILGFLIHQHYSKIKVLLYSMEVEKNSHQAKLPPSLISCEITIGLVIISSQICYYYVLPLKNRPQSQARPIISNDLTYFFFLSAKTSTKFTKTKTGHTYDNPSHQGLRGQFCSLKNDLSSWSRQMWSSHGFPHF